MRFAAGRAPLFGLDLAVALDLASAFAFVAAFTLGFAGAAALRRAGLAASVTAIPAYEECADYARLMGHPITGVKLDANLKMDLDAMQQASEGAGLVFYCNPNNPVATAVTGSDTRAYLDTPMKASPTTTVLVDEASFEFFGQTAIGWLAKYQNLFVSRTFSKAFGLAALRVGCLFSQAENIAAIRKGQSPYSVNSIAVIAALEAIKDTGYVKKYVAEMYASRKLLMDELRRVLDEALDQLPVAQRAALQTTCSTSQRSKPAK